MQNRDRSSGEWNQSLVSDDIRGAPLMAFEQVVLAKTGEKKSSRGSSYNEPRDKAPITACTSMHEKWFQVVRKDTLFTGRC